MQPDAARLLETTVNFRRWRERLRLTQRQAAAAIGYSLRQIQKYDAGTPPPHYIRLAMVALEDHPDLIGTE